MSAPPPFPVAGLERVPGFLTPRDAALMADLAGAQAGMGVRGDIAELGVFYGRSALVLGSALHPGDRLFACDRFDVPADGVPGWAFDEARPPEEAFRARWAEAFGHDAALVLRAGDVRELRPADLGAPARLVHVDAGHEYADVRGDLALAAESLHPRGAIVADDVLLPEWPDVTVALVDHIREGAGRWVPVAVAQHKAVLCRAEAADAYRAWAAEAVPAAYPAPGFLAVERRFDGVPVLVASRVSDDA